MPSNSASLLDFGVWTPFDWINHLWQSTVVGLVMLLLLLLGRKLAARTRLALGWLALGKFAIPIAVLSAATGFIGRAPSHWFAAEMPAIAARVPVAGTPMARVAEKPAMSLLVETRVSPAIVSTAVAFWLAGFAALSAAWIVRAVRVRRRLLKEATPLSEAVAQHLAPAAELVGLKEIPRCLTVDGGQGPALVGVFSPVVILPRGLEAHLTPAELRAVLVHEFVHLQRCDNLIGALRAFCGAALWFNPVAWLLNRNLGADAEKACDERVLKLTRDPDAYVGGIVKSIQHTLGLAQPGLAGMTTPPVVERIKNILDRDARPIDPRLNLLAVLTGVTLVGLSGFGGTLIAAAPALASEPEPAAPVVVPASAAVVARAEPTLEVDFPDEDIRQIIRNVADLFQVNVVFPAELEGKATIKLKNATWRQIFRITLAPIGYTFIEDGKTVTIVRAESVGAIAAPAAAPVAVEDLAPLSAQARLVERAEHLKREAEALQRDVDAAKAAQADSPETKTAPEAAADAASVAALDARRQATEIAAAATIDSAEGAATELKHKAEIEQQHALAPDDRAKQQKMISLDFVDARLKAPDSAQPPPTPVVGSVVAATLARLDQGAPDGLRASGIAIFEPGQLDRAPVPTFQARPQYPFAQRRAGTAGEAKIDFLVDPKGDVQDAYAVTFTHADFATAAVEAVTKWKFKPGRKAGAAVYTHLQVPIVFTLNGR